MIQKLISLPGNFAGIVHEVEKERQAPEWFATSDPAGKKLGSGGGTAHLLVDAWRGSAGDASFDEWLDSSQKLIIHGGGMSRRLPAYAPFGKAFMPLPIAKGIKGASPDRKLIDAQLPILEELLRKAGPNYRCLIASGDALICHAEDGWKNIPEVDALCVGIDASPGTASRHGVFFSKKSSPERLDFVLQKPSISTIDRLSETHLFLLDSGYAS